MDRSFGRLSAIRSVVCFPAPLPEGFPLTPPAAPTVVSLHNVTEVATALGVTASTVYAWVSERRIPTIRLGSRTIRVRGDVLERLQREGVPSRPQI